MELRNSIESQIGDGLDVSTKTDLSRQSFRLSSHLQSQMDLTSWLLEDTKKGDSELWQNIKSYIILISPSVELTEKIKQTPAGSKRRNYRPGMALNDGLGDDYEIVATVICGDNYLEKIWIQQIQSLRW